MLQILQNPTLVLFSVLFLGLALGNIKFKGIALGSSGVLFVALLAGHLGLEVPEGIRSFSTALFVYCVGLGVGNRFFASLQSQGSKLVIISVVVVGTAWVLSVTLCSFFGISGEMAAGIFAGALTSTPALAAASESLVDSAMVDIGYGVAYPFGVIGVVLFVQLLPQLLKQDLSKLCKEDTKSADSPQSIISRVVTVTNSDYFGKSILDFENKGQMLCRITRRVENMQMHPLDEGDFFSENEGILLVGARDVLQREALILGHIARDKQHPRSYGDECVELILLNKALCHKTLSELKPLSNYGLVFSRITRLGETFVPTGSTELVRNDVLRVVGQPKDIEKFCTICGHRSSAINATDILSLTGGVALGILVGNISIGFGEGASFSLGMAGGPLIVALILGHFGKIGPLVGYMPRPTRILLMELALMLFLASAGVAGGDKLVATLQAQGLSMLIIGAMVTLIPMLLGYIIATKMLKMSLPEALGGICGSMTSTPALGAITAKTEGQSPIIAYATAYPAALILMTVLAKAILSFT